MTSPASWTSFVALCPNDAIRNASQLSRFKARYSLAINFQELTLSQGSQGLQDSYSSALRVTLAYTALESLETALGTRNQTSIFNNEIAQEFRNPRNAKLMKALIYGQSKRDMTTSQKELARFSRNESDDLRPIVYSIRNLMSHGTLTAAGLDLSPSKTRRALLDRLAIATLEGTNDRFTKHVLKLRRKLNRV